MAPSILLQNLDTLFAHCLEATRVEVERIEDRRRDLGGEREVLDDLRLFDARRGYHQRHVVGEAAMLGKLGPAGADDAVIGDGMKSGTRLFWNGSS